MKYKVKTKIVSAVKNPESTDFPTPMTPPKVEINRVPSEVIDLAGPSRVTQAEPLAPGEQLVCDLTEEEDAPKWAKRRAR